MSAESIDAPPLPTPGGVPHNLPLPVTSFVGREREIGEVERLLAGEPGTLWVRPRLLTLTGAGGCGKTRLALRVAADVLASHPDGVWLVELAALSDPALVAQTVTIAVGAREVAGQTPAECLEHFLRPRRVLLVLDNCEHLVGEVARLVDALLRRCPGLRVLATSREALGSAGEVTWRVPSLALPSPGPAAGGLPPARLLEYEAVRLFVERARAARPGFAVAERDLPALVEVCRRLDGIPLALELAAARVRVFSVAQLAALLATRWRPGPCYASET